MRWHAVVAANARVISRLGPKPWPPSTWRAADSFLSLMCRTSRVGSKVGSRSHAGCSFMSRTTIRLALPGGCRPE